ncbi:MAG: hypothetical protein ACP5ER_00530 [Candidatus Bathyarchaeales archaeon]
MVRWREIIRCLIPVVVLFFVSPALVIYYCFSWGGSYQQGWGECLDVVKGNLG